MLGSSLGCYYNKWPIWLADEGAEHFLGVGLDLVLYPCTTSPNGKHKSHPFLLDSQVFSNPCVLLECFPIVEAKNKTVVKV